MELTPPDQVLTILHERGADGTTRLRVAGELDAHSAPELAEAFEPAASEGAAVEVDLTDVPFVDSSGLAALLEARRRLDEAGGSLTVTAASPAAIRLFEITGVRQHIMRDPS